MSFLIQTKNNFPIINTHQKRVSTPKRALQNGSDWLVMGRSITKGNIKKNIQKLLNHLK